MGLAAYGNVMIILKSMSEFSNISIVTVLISKLIFFTENCVSTCTIVYQLVQLVLQLLSFLIWCFGRPYNDLVIQVSYNLLCNNV